MPRWLNPRGAGQASGASAPDPARQRTEAHGGCAAKDDNAAGRDAGRRESGNVPWNQPSETSNGFGRTLVAIYAVFALAASARSIFQLFTKVDDAPVAYALSAFAGVVYVVATVALARNLRRRALATITIELVGVLTVGVLSNIDEDLFPDQTVWSGFGEGYGFIPLVLPLVGLWWLHRTRKRV